MGMKEAILLLAVVALAESSFAQPDETCEGTTYDTSMCFLRILKGIEAELNSTYRLALNSVRRSYTARDMQNLRTAERRWIAYRDAACNAEYGLWGRGTGGPPTHTICLIRIDKQRIADLKEAYLLEDSK